jgi:hypothetical protein
MKTIRNNQFIWVSCLSGFLLFWLYYPAHSVSLSSFHNDDTRLIQAMSSIKNIPDIFSFIFDISAFKFRPLAHLNWLIEYQLFGNYYLGYIAYNIAFMAISAGLFFMIVSKYLNNLGRLLIMLTFLTSRFFTYSLWNITGSFESLALILFLIIIYLVINRSDNDRKSLIKIILLSIALILTNERYLPFLIILPLMSKSYFLNGIKFNSFIKKIMYSTLILLSFILLRLTLDVPVFVGTTTDNIAKSFSFERVISFYIKAIFEVSGFSSGPRYLTGFEFVHWVPINQWPSSLLILTSASLLLTGLSLNYLLSIINKNNLGLFLCFLIMLLSASVTFRLEMRWLAPSYVLLLILFASHGGSLFLSECKSVSISKFESLWFKLNFSLILVMSLAINLYYIAHLREGLYFAGELSKASLFKFILIKYF